MRPIKLARDYSMIIVKLRVTKTKVIKAYKMPTMFRKKYYKISEKMLYHLIGISKKLKIRFCKDRIAECKSKRIRLT